MAVTLIDRLTRLGVILSCLLGLLLNTSADAQKLAFPGAQGWAAYTPGGRGGKIIRVTNLNCQGAGSLAEAIAETGSRIIVFDVGGIIDLQGSVLSIHEPFLTIAGQTAPSPGITIIDGGVSIRTHDVIVQHLKIRPGAARHTEGWEPDGISTYKASNVIIDHCSITWAVDENCSASGPRFEGITPDKWRKNTSHEITMSNNIISEGLSQATHSKGEHSKGTLIHDNVTNVAVLNNLYSSNKDRNPLFKGGARGVIANNYIYNPGGLAIGYIIVADEWEGHSFEAGKLSVVKNVLQYGNDTRDISLVYANQGPCEIYMDGNIAKNRFGNDIPQYKSDPELLVNNIPVWNDNILLVETKNLLENMSRHIGARPWERDEIDTRIINNVINKGGRIINLETEVGGFGVAKGNYSEFKTDEWNLNYMIKLSPQIFIQEPTNGSAFRNDSIISASLNTASFGNEIEYAELFLEGESLGRDYNAPFSWEFYCKEPGVHSVVAFVLEKNGMFYASRSIQLSILSATGTRPDLRNNTESLHFMVFPNPTDDSFFIKYTLNQKNDVMLKFFDSQGLLIHKTKTKTRQEGMHIFSWNRGKLPPGVYYVVIEAGEYTNARKIIYN